MVTPFSVRDPNATHLIIELFGGDNNLSKYVNEDLAEMQAGNTGPVVVLALADRAGAGGAEVIEISARTGRNVIEKLGEIDTGDPRTLASFISRALVSYPAAERRVLGFWDHGSGVFDEHDPNEVILQKRLFRTPRGAARKLFIPRSYATNERMRAMLHDDTSGGVLTNREASGVLLESFKAAQMDGKKLDMIFSDTCLNGMVEVLSEFAPFAHVITASEELEPGDGWDYQLWLKMLSQAPPTDADAWGNTAVMAFGESYKNRKDEHPVTMASFRTKVDIAGPFKELVDILRKHDPEGYMWLNMTRPRTQSFARMATYDMRDLLERTAKIAKVAEVATACKNVVHALNASCIRSVAWGKSVKKAHGLALWLPADQYGFETVAETYQELSFAKETGWVDYLRPYYAD